LCGHRYIRLVKNISDIPFLPLLLQPLKGILLRFTRVLLEPNLLNDLIRTLSQPARRPTKEDLRALPKQRLQLLALRPDTIGNVPVARLRPALRERGPHLDNALRLPRRQLVAVQEVALRVAAPEVQQRAARRPPARRRRQRPLLHEAAHRRDARARRHHDDRHGRVARQVEAGVGGAHEAADVAAGAFVGQVRRRDASEHAVVAASRGC